jgi:hypothetical protein
MRFKIFGRNTILLAGLLIPLAEAASGNWGDLLNESEEKIQLESRLKQVRINAKIREAELQAEAELQRKQEVIVKPAQAQADIPIRPPKWVDVAAKPEFKTLSPERQAEAKQAYFDYWIAPLVGNQADELRIKFLGSKNENLQRVSGLLWGALTVLCFSLFLYRARRQAINVVNAIRAIGVAILKNSNGIAALLIATAITAVAVRMIFGAPLVLFMR